jgi:hypothetical protein
MSKSISPAAANEIIFGLDDGNYGHVVVQADWMHSWHVFWLSRTARFEGIDGNLGVRAVSVWPRVPSQGRAFTNRYTTMRNSTLRVYPQLLRGPSLSADRRPKVSWLRKQRRLFP